MIPVGERSPEVTCTMRLISSPLPVLAIIFIFIVLALSPLAASAQSACGRITVGTVTLLANATDDVGVVGVQFKLDGANFGTELTTTPYSTPWDTTKVQNGCHTLTAIARDA